MKPINHLSQDIFSLPFVTLENHHLLPSQSGIYFLRSANQIWYIGMSKDINSRWYSHDVLKKVGNTKKQLFISWLIYEGNLLRLERKFIDKYRPYLNIVDNPDIENKRFVNISINNTDEVDVEINSTPKKSGRKQIRITLQPELKPDADALCKAYGLRDYSQLLAFLIRTNGTKLLTLTEKN